MSMNADGYRRKREEYKAEAMRHHTLLCYFFGKRVDPVADIVKKLNEQLRAREINQMKAEINEIRKETNT